jgi:hypothetical protein
MAKQVVQSFVYAEAADLSATYTGPAWQSEALYAPFIQVTTSNASSLNVSYSIQGTSDLQDLDSTPQNWVTLSEFTAKAVTSNGTVYWLLPDTMLSCKFIRFVSTRTAGSGNARIVIAATRVG